MMKNILLIILIYLAIAGISFLLAPLLTYVLFVLIFFLAFIGYTIDVILSLLLWWAGYDGDIGGSILGLIYAMPSHTTIWIIFMAILTIIFFICFIPSKPSKNLRSKSEKHVYTKDKVVSEPPVQVYRSFTPPLGEMVQPFRADYRKGKITMEKANDMIKTIIDIWVDNNGYSQEKANEMYEKFKVK